MKPGFRLSLLCLSMLTSSCEKRVKTNDSPPKALPKASPAPQGNVQPPRVPSPTQQSTHSTEGNSVWSEVTAPPPSEIPLASGQSFVLAKLELISGFDARPLSDSGAEPPRTALERNMDACMREIMEASTLKVEGQDLSILPGRTIADCMNAKNNETTNTIGFNYEIYLGMSCSLPDGISSLNGETLSSPRVKDVFCATGSGSFSYSLVYHVEEKAGTGKLVKSYVRKKSISSASGPACAFEFQEGKRIFNDCVFAERAEDGSATTMFLRADLQKSLANVDSTSAFHHVSSTMRYNENGRLPPEGNDPSGQLPSSPPSACVAPEAPTIEGPERVIGSGTPESCTFASLKATVAAGGKVSFNCGEGAVTIVFPEILSLPSVSIDGGNKVIFDGGGKTALVKGTPDNSFILKNLTFQNGFIDTKGNISSDGAAVTAAHNATTYVKGCSFLNNKVVGSLGGGGAFRGRNGKLSHGIIIDSKFVGNSSEHLGGAIYSVLSNLSIINSVFQKNRAGSAGAIMTDGAASVGLKNGSLGENNGMIHLCGVKLIQNEAYGVGSGTEVGGGAGFLYVYGDPTLVPPRTDSIKIEKTYVFNNSAKETQGSFQAVGGGLRIQGGRFEVVDSFLPTTP